MRISSFEPINLLTPQEFTRAESVAKPAATTAGIGAAGLPGAVPQPVASPTEQSAEFSEVLGKELNRVNAVMAEADRQSQLVATGQAEDLQQAVTAMAEADLALQVTMHVTQKAIAAYQEISRMQI